MNEFFKEYNLDINKPYNTDGSNNLSVDGSGTTQSVTEINARKILLLIETIMENKPYIHMDLGAGACWLSKIVDENDKNDSYSI